MAWIFRIYALVGSACGVGLFTICFSLALIMPCNPPIIISVMPSFCPSMGYVGKFGLPFRLAVGSLAGYLVNSIGAMVGFLLCYVMIHPSRVELILLDDLERFVYLFFLFVILKIYRI